MNKLLKTGFVLLILLASTVVFFSCAKKEVKPLNFALSGNPDTLDPQATSGTLTFQVDKSIYDTLTEPNEKGVIVPALAESWKVSKDSLVWTFHLRKGVKFQNGDPLTSADVKATFERIVDKKTGSPNKKAFDVIKSIETPDDLTVVFTLGKPYAPFLASISSGWGAILPKSLIDAGHDFASEPVGTGPYKMTEWVRDSKIVLVKNKDYWMKGYPKINKIVMNIIPESSVQIQGLLSGQLDIVYMVSKDNVPLLQKSPDITLTKNLTSLIMVMAINCSRPPFNNLKVRQALNYAIDKQKVLDTAYSGGKVIGTFMDYGNAYYKDFTSLYPYNPEKAKQLLKEAGVGKDTVIKMYLPQNYPPHVKAGEMYQDMLSKVGLNVKIQMVDWSTWITDVYRGSKFDLTVIGHTGKLDPNGTLSGYGKGKYVQWYNDEAASLIEKAAETMGYKNRKVIYDKVLGIMAEQVPFVYVGSSYRTSGIRKNVTGFRMTPNLDTFDFRWTEFK